MRIFWRRRPIPGGRVFQRFLGMAGLAGLFFLGGCAYELPAQPTIFVTKKTPDNLSELLRDPAAHQGQVAVLGGQILRRVDTPVGRYFLIRDLPLGENSYPMPSSPIRIRKPPADTAFVLFAPSLKMMGGTKPATDREKSAFVVFGRHNNKTMVVGPGHLVTAVGEVRGRVPFPGDKSKTHYLLLVSHYIMLWSRARTEDYPLVLVR
ncbi:hypothetical protein Y981_01060 [Leptospirillum ferriphilum YSK]|uniref:Lipoprotein n=1 Tax=Leptospirillum ferriphilum YSK TaxID=1441628 RepID=A0A059XWC7_9BACT|nr:hypothetical protein Y981_01060 [Leptospirillum ferriphilum YSK]